MNNSWIKLNHETKENYPPNKEVVLIAYRNECTGTLRGSEAYYIAPKSKE